MDYIIVVILGLVVGSFLNVCIYRIPREESIIYPPSHCGSCNRKLKSLDLFPIFSYVFLKGKCRYCKEKISIRYPLIESLNGILYLIIYLKFGLTILSLKYCILASILIVIGIIDLKTQFVYTSTTIFAGFIGMIFIIAQALSDKTISIDFIFGGLIGFGIIGLIVSITHGMGEGDIEIAAFCGLFLGVKLILLNLFIAIIFGGITGIIVLLLKLKGARDKIAFGPFIGIGTIVSMLYGNELIQMYLKFFQ
ncbi:type 4 prepilin-like protein leader peptide-processing enzyme [Clostridium puniceum]|uniref:Type 4 prepilin-like protein leader peptide-processing enzyme n=1 Tax=Clostridium puniceum TaxID=29367 RepID=A0A1S8T6Y2_9CLOT|nr:A24 family peptidase [Clostridium puniceum]OOM73389.1 type 4 prepilin-like protein leader peptide-processing enzyme [Clostridium puniceum]